MSAQPILLFQTGRVLVTDGVVYVREFDECDDEVVRVVADADDPVAAVGHCLRVGAWALRAADVSVDVNVIERSFSELESRFEAKVTDAVDEIARASAGLLDAEDGASRAPCRRSTPSSRSCSATRSTPTRSRASSATSSRWCSAR